MNRVTDAAAVDDKPIRTTDPDSSQSDSGSAIDSLDAHVVFLVNFLAPNHIEVCREVARRVGKFTVLCSVAMEGNRDWKPDWGDLDVRVQRTVTRTRELRHPDGYRETNYTHIPLDTIGQLSRLRPDAIVSLELGARTGLAATYRTISRRCALVASVYASERSEAARSGIRRVLRRRLLKAADWITYNGPSCKRYLHTLGASDSKMSPWDYAADPRKPYRGPLPDSESRDSLQLLTVGQLSERKGVLQAADQLARWCRMNPDRQLGWHLVGSGPLADSMAELDTPQNLTLVFHGHCDPDQIREHYRTSDAMLFPTLCDEWGLVVDEALHSGLPVLGSIHSQAAETLIQDGENGYRFDPESSESLGQCLDRWSDQTPRQHADMCEAARRRVGRRTPETSAIQFVSAAAHAIERRFGRARLNRFLTDRVGGNP